MSLFEILLLFETNSLNLELILLRLMLMLLGISSF